MIARALPTPRKASRALRNALLRTSRELHRRAFLQEWRGDQSPDKLRDLTVRLARLVAGSMALGDLSGRAEVASRRTGNRDRPDTGARFANRFVELPFEEAIDYIASLRPAVIKAGADIPDVAATYQAMEFRLRADLSLSVVKTVQAQIAALLREGGTVRDFRQWAGDLGRGYVSDAAADRIFRTEVNRAQNAGRFRQVMDDPALRGWIVAWRYKTVGDTDVRKNHRKLNTKMWRIGHEAWRTIYPPNGWQCRCRTEAISLPQAKRMNRWREDDALPAGGEFIDSEWPVAGGGPDPGFDGSPVQEIYRG